MRGTARVVRFMPSVVDCRLFSLLVVLAGAFALASMWPHAAYAVSCGNEAIRSSGSSSVNPTTGQPYDLGLPECRAYEKVTPDYKQASDMVMRTAEGEGINWVTGGNYLAGEGSVGVSNAYIANRTAEGWLPANVVAPERFTAGLFTGLLFKFPLYGAGFSAVAWCGLQGESAREAIFNLPQPYACAIRNSQGEWFVSPSIVPVNKYANGASIPLKSLLERGASADLSHIIFTSPVRFLASDTATGTTESLYEWVNPTSSEPILRLVNVDNNGNLIGPNTAPALGSGNNNTFQAVSSNGSIIYFTATPTGGTSTLYARVGGITTTAVSNPSPAECSSCESTVKQPVYNGASADGKQVYFLTKQQLVNSDADTGNNAACTATNNVGCDLYEYDFESSAGHHLIQASGGGSGDLTPGLGANVQGVLRVSPDGTHVYFVSPAVLTTEPNGRGQVATSSSPNIYVFERDAEFPLGRIRFVATVLSGEIGTALTSLVGKNSPSQTTPDGRYLVFQTSAQLITAGAEVDTDSSSDVYRYDSQTGELIRITIGEPGYPASNNGNTPGMNAVLEPLLSQQSGAQEAAMAHFRGNAAISDDGNSVIFSTPETLQTDDVNNPTNATSAACLGSASAHLGCDVYIWREGLVSLVSDGQPVAGSEQIAFQGGRISASGDDVFFTSRNQLVPGDRDRNVDIYDARIDGGFPFSPSVPQCEQNAGCHGAPPSEPGAEGPASSSFNGVGNEVLPASKKHKKASKKHKKASKKHKKASKKHKKASKKHSKQGKRDMAANRRNG